jgi:hypothetical protein
MKLPRVKYNDKVIVSMTTTPNKIKKIKPMIKSVLSQTVRIDQISLNIPPECQGKKFEIPKDIETMVNVYKCGRDYGSGTKCIPTVLRENDSETLVILLEDSYIYCEDFIETLIGEYKKNPNHCIYGKGFILIKCGFVKEDIVDITKEQVSDKLLMRYITAPKKQFHYPYKNFTI